jgi:thiamine-monophosphate kinase
MPERELVDYIRELTAEGPSWLDVGVGDDAAVLTTPGGERLVVTTDSVVEGVHFAPGASPRLVGRKAIARGLSDVAAMAARPLCTLAAAFFGPSWSAGEARELSDGLVEAALEFGAPLVGGDVASGEGPTGVTVTALGTPGPAGAVRRDGARPGDAVCVTGRLGGSIRGRHLEFAPRVAEALALAKRCELHALIDVSDGLSTDALHLARAGGVGIVLRAAAVPISADAVQLASETGREPLWHALNDGEDYELLFCLPAPQGEELAAEGLAGLEVSLIGEVVPGPESRLVQADGREAPLLSGGWEHMRA